MSETLQKLKELLIKRLKLKVTAEQINEDTRLFGPDSLGLDSIDVLELVVGIKREFGVEIADRQTAEKVFTSVGAIVHFIEERK
ncbi:MAG TPA: phosphopantetheine-binding protein [Dissulfurispiraceae bacterium]|nr:phosphopantetheine-binding protein [Dissulfurispiraceae bacterium]